MLAFAMLYAATLLARYATRCRYDEHGATLRRRCATTPDTPPLPPPFYDAMMLLRHMAMIMIRACFTPPPRASTAFVAAFLPLPLMLFATLVLLSSMPLFRAMPPADSALITFLAILHAYATFVYAIAATPCYAELRYIAADADIDTPPLMMPA